MFFSKRFCVVLALFFPYQIAVAQDVCRTEDSCAKLNCKGLCYETDCHGYCPRGQVVSSTDASKNKDIRIHNASPELEAKIKTLIEESIRQ